ncbi:hypothetical protein TSAR_001166 [Trichomalopsis sarcophagae]|uniref:Uncharacterized protein n=1 Tax=Trichomalopsis sarcophagae TaxID=543379 RepID=A0A232EPX3_9HYME|nr:hypothetical protein TSAR_001166 [Trichomalopsis sarcophagae]
MTFSYKFSPRTDALLIKRRFSVDCRRDSKHHAPTRTPPATRLSGLTVTDRLFSLSALKLTLKICGVKIPQEVVVV